MHSVSGINDRDNLFSIAIDQSYLATITQGDGEQVLDIKVALRGFRTIFRGDDNLPGGSHFLHAKFRRLGRVVL